MNVLNDRENNKIQALSKDEMAKTKDSEPTSKALLSRDRVLQSAIQLADQAGITSLSMRKLAEGLGVKAMSLYNHVANKDDLLDGMVDIVTSEIELPSLEIAWKTAMQRRATSAQTVLMRHPWATMAMV